MPDPKLDFDPITGFNDASVFTTNPATQVETRGLLQRLFTQIQIFINTTLIAWVKSTFATKSELAGIALGSIPNGSLTEAQMTNGMKKGIVGGVESYDDTAVHLADNVKHVTGTERTAWNAKQAVLGFTAENSANKSVANGYAGLGSDGLVPSTQLPGDGTWEKIAEQTLGSAVAQVDFTSIPTDYKEFKILYNAKSNHTLPTGLKMRFNTDVGANYDWYDTSINTAATEIQVGLLGYTTTYYGFGEIIISDLSANLRKNVMARSLSGAAAAVALTQTGGHWFNVSAKISTISFFPASASFISGSRFVLWGCK